MDFFNQEAHARKQTRLLVVLFGFAVFASVVLTYLILAIPIRFFSIALAASTSLFQFLWDTRLAFWVTLGALVSITLGCFYKMRVLSGGGSAVAELLGGRKIESSTTDPEEQRLRNVVEEMAIASGLPVPEIYLLDRERGVNSFAAGHTRDDVAIGVTFGAMKLLTRDELQGIVAHEFSHVLNGDTRLNMRLMVLAHGLFWPTLVGRILVRGSTQAPEIGDSIFDPETGSVFMPTAPLGFLFLFIGAVSLPFVRLTKSAICREREWLADAAAVQFTRNPAGIEGALKKIGGLFKAGRLDTPFAETASHLYFADSDYDPWLDFFSTHPPLAKRILAIDPAFNGEFEHIKSLPLQSVEMSREAQLDRLYQENLRRARAEARAREEN
jgi:Zn-dependent protease with chaperone function